MPAYCPHLHDSEGGVTGVDERALSWNMTPSKKTSLALCLLFLFVHSAQSGGNECRNEKEGDGDKTRRIWTKVGPPSDNCLTDGSLKRVTKFVGLELQIVAPELQNGSPLLSERVECFDAGSNEAREAGCKEFDPEDWE